MPAHRSDTTRYLSEIASWVDGADLNPPGLNGPAAAVSEDLQTLSTRQFALYEFMRALVDAYGKFDQTLGADNARYLGATSNPMAIRHESCSTCVFFEKGSCDLVNGDIQPGGICQYALIPDVNIVAAAQNVSSPGKKVVRKTGTPGTPVDVT